MQTNTIEAKEMKKIKSILPKPFSVEASERGTSEEEYEADTDLILAMRKVCGLYGLTNEVELCYHIDLFVTRERAILFDIRGAK